MGSFRATPRGNQQPCGPAELANIKHRKMIRVFMAVLTFGAFAVLLSLTPNFLHSSSMAVAGIWANIFPPRDLWESTLNANAGGEYLIGVGKGDITGPVVEINFMGYANPSQLGTGLRQRLYSRAFIIGDVASPSDRFVYLVLDTQSGDTAVRDGILAALQQMGGEYAVYGQNNTAVVGTHSHSGPGAWLNYLLPQITSRGFYQPSYQAIVDGTVASIVQAHQSLAPGQLSVGQIAVDDANINRSPYAYLANPAAERAKYENNVDKNMTVLRFSRTSGSTIQDIGLLSWFAVHGTSMYENNTLVTGDNKGVAAYLFEKSTGNPNFVAGFSQANVGDTTPNILGPYCQYGPQVGQQCDFKTSLCDGKAEPCQGRGPYFEFNDNGTASAYEIGTRQFQAAQSLFTNRAAFAPVSGSVVKSVHQFVDLSTFHFILPNGTAVRTCPAALGYSFAAGTSDGAGLFDFKQAQPGDPHANPLWAVVGDLIHAPNETQIECQGVKPILLDVGESNTPYAWTPNIVDIQLFRVGQMFIIVSPGEATTMSGRRWRDAVGGSATSNLADLAGTAPVVVLGGPANSYTHYIATPEEYSVQRYEGASTLYGPHTLDAYINLTLTYLPYLSSTATKLPALTGGPLPPNNVNRSLDFITPVITDNPPFFKSFGDVLADVQPSYNPGDTISATFVGADPRNNLRLGQTFAAVEKAGANGVWTQVRDDADWSLVYEWKRMSTILGTSDVTISWETAWETGAWATGQADAEEQGDAHRDLAHGKRTDTLTGTYRFKYYGDSKALTGSISSFSGTSSQFTIS